MTTNVGILYGMWLTLRAVDAEDAKSCEDYWLSRPFLSPEERDELAALFKAATTPTA